MLQIRGKGFSRSMMCSFRVVLASSGVEWRPEKSRTWMWRMLKRKETHLSIRNLEISGSDIILFSTSFSSPKNIALNTGLTLPR